MAGRRLNIEWRAEDTPEALKAAWQVDREHAVKIRLHGLWLIRCGRTMGDVASVLGVHDRTVRNWVDWYRSGGLQEVTVRRRGGKGGQSRLNEEQMVRLAWEIAAGRLVTASDVKNWVAYQYGMKYTMPGVYSLMHRARALYPPRLEMSAQSDFQPRREEVGWWRRISASVLRFLSLVKKWGERRLSLRSRGIQSEHGISDASR